MKQGFILIDVLITLIVSSLLSIVLFVTISQVSQGTRFVEQIIDLNSRALIAFKQLERDVSGAMIDPNKITKNFFSEEKDGNCQLLTFITNNPLQQWHSSNGTPRLVRVTYKLVPDAAHIKGDQYILTRQESTNLAFEKESHTNNNNDKGRSYELIDGIVGFKTVYVPVSSTATKSESAKQSKKILVWDSDSPLDNEKKREDSQKLPAQVTFQLVLADNAQKKQSFEFAIVIQPDMVPYDTIVSTT